MKCKHWVTALLLLPLYAFSYPQDDLKNILTTKDTIIKNTQTLTYSNDNGTYFLNTTNRSDFPTQIIRMNTDVSTQRVTCEEVHAQINKVLIEHIVTKQFIYVMHISCHYDPNTYLAKHFIINSYFDPVNEEAITFLKSYLDQYNGSDLLGSQLKIESAKGLIISLSIAVGTKKKPTKPPFTEYRRDRSNFYFKSNYDMTNKLFTDVKENFYSNNPSKILPFLDRWVFSHAGSLYKVILRDANYVELQPERIFIMEQGEEIFVSGIKQYFTHYCEQYQNHRCLSPS